ncbi:phage portal protein [Mammaliicoccus sciuri]|uniref:Phage portal protein n=1 Tax=Mammaliicoccus sciuri TaxID=1296 RepID=A0ABT7HVS8_MAMSC|nr:phage portal protein [Mammaliicoccus sciuri]MCJ0913270.1 phage portal protein [Mammaliicoccus sciuri]MDL0112345.1 phage portal protein [Mammaliicoccus sciuri]MDL0116221.1 phage portal protein [Mammaliicoccus sciuri]
MAGFFEKIFGRHEEASWMYDLEFFQDTTTKVYLKNMALQTNIEFLARTISQSEFRIMNNNKSIKDKTWHKLNIRPNTDLSSSDFWQKVIYKLIYENEVLIVQSDTKDLLVADSYDRKEFALYPDRFSHVMVKDFEFERSFEMGEVIYLTYNNNKLSSFVDGLFGDYGEIFGRMISAQMRNNQIRGIVNVDSSKKMDSEEIQKMQDYVNKITSSFSTNAVAVAPLTKGFEYQEVSGSTKTGSANFEDLAKLKKSLQDDVAKAIGIPPALINGELADMDNALESYIKFCIKPLIKKIEDELNAKLFTESDVIKGRYIKVVGIDKKDPLEHAESVDKLVSSGTFTRNHVRVMFGEEPSDDAELDNYLVTKNYTESLEGGDTDED